MQIVQKIRFVQPQPHLLRLVGDGQCRNTDLPHSDLSALDESVHWFCPRSFDDQDGTYFDEDCLDKLATESKEEKAIRQEKVEGALRCKNDALSACQILAFDGADAETYQKQMKAHLRRQLTRCEVCVREFHRSRSHLRTTLEADYDMDEVRGFFDKFDAMNIERIGEGLNLMTEALHDLPPQDRNPRAAGDVGMYALFEALNCKPLLMNEEKLQQFFDQPFRLAQSKKKLRLPNYVPGMGAFLFSHKEARADFANNNFTKNKRDLTGAEFEFSVRPYLAAAATRVNIISLELAFLPQFWHAVRLIVNRLNKDIITKYLRPMELNLYQLAMEHWQIDAPHFPDMLASFQRLMELSPNDFWDGMGNITGQNVIEGILRAPSLQRLLRSKETDTKLDEYFAWVVPFITSIKPALLGPPARALFDQLLHKLQGNEYSPYAKHVSWKIGLQGLKAGIKRVRTLGSGPVVVHLLEIIAKEHIGDILQELEGIEKKNAEMAIGDGEQLCLDIIEESLALDVNSLAHSRQVLLSNRTLAYDIDSSSLQLWKSTTRLIKPGSPVFATAILAGTTGLLGLQKFTDLQLKAAGKTPDGKHTTTSRQAEAWNAALDRLLAHIRNELLERLDPFTPDQLVGLFLEPKAAKAITMLLFSGDTDIHRATLGLIKTLSGEDERREAMMHMIKCFFSATLTHVASAQSVIARAGNFSPCSTLLKLSSDILSCLWDSSDGYLRTATIVEANEVRALESLWEMSWIAIDMIFRQTEPWSNLGYDKKLMQDFCRETMDLAEFAFEQYSIFTATLRLAAKKEAEARGSSATEAKEIGKKLLKFPTEAFGNIIRWLRLRDDYLITKAVNLTCKMLLRLQGVGVKIEQDAAQRLETWIMSSGLKGSGKNRTNLSMNQKAQLQQALETHLGEELEGIVDAKPASTKQGTLSGWASGGSSGRSTPVSGATKTASGKTTPGTIDVDAWAAKSEADKAKREHEKAYGDLMGGIASKGQGAYQKFLADQKAAAKKAMPATQKAAQKHQDDSKNFLARRRAEVEAQKKARAEALAKQKLGVGSGVLGLGDIGKDHSLKGQNVMVSSDEESEEEEDDDLDDDLFGGKIKEKTKQARPQLDAGAIGLRPEVKKGPTRIQRTARSLKDMRARLAPDLQSLHKTILKWDFFHNGDYPPGANEHIFQEVRNSYSDPVSYQQTFEPLLTLEAWQNLIRAREENTNKPYEVKVANRSNVDNFIEISSAVSQAENRDLGLQEGDVILLSKARRPTEDETAPHCLARINKMKRQKQNLDIVYQIMPGTSLSNSLRSQAVVWGVKVQSITPLEREYGALQGLQYYDLCSQICKAKPSQKISYSEKAIERAMDNWTVNRAQSEAINAALENEGFSLIQGPPGSGKTKTIVAIVGGLLSNVLGSGAGGAKQLTGFAANGEAAASKKLLVCAPSNAAVDELVMRLKEGVKTRNGKHQSINVVRIGRSDAINTQVLDVTMDELVAKRIGGNDSDGTRARHQQLFDEHKAVSEALRQMYEKRDKGELKGKDLTDLENEIVSVRKRKNELGVRIDTIKDQERNAGREAELNRKRAQQAVLDNAHVICATLSGSGHDMFQSLNIEFETVIIDEAAQCVEMSSLIPLKYGCVKCVMVGDPKQLPPTVFSKEAARFQYEQSLFVRMQNNSPDEVHLLDTQYRMHPDISLFPSRTFYDDLLKDGEGMAAGRERPWHASALLAPYKFFDVQGQHQTSTKGHSLVNVAEVEVAMQLYERLTTDFKEYEYSGRVGVITPYKSQLRMLRDRFANRFGQEIFDIIEFNTTDAFQGRESEIIIFSCVRASPSGGIGFLQDIRRMNVGLTRAKSSLWVLGNSDSLVRGQFWRKLVEDAKARDAWVSGDVKGMLRKPSKNFAASKQQTASMWDVDSHVSQMGNEKGAGRKGQVRKDGRERRSGSATPAPASRKPSNAGSDDMRKTGFPGQGPPVPPDSDKMEGIRYRFEDRISKKSVSTSVTAADDNDVDMADADEAASAASSTAIVRSRDETPLSNASGHSGANDRANGTAAAPVKPKPGGGAPVAHIAGRKRPAANSPFIPKKKPGR